MAHYLFNFSDGDRQQATVLLRANMWGVGRDERYRDALAPGDLALIFMPSGGVFIGGGIAPVIAARLRSGGFRDAFVNKPPREAILRTFATAIIVHPAAALAGIRALIVRPEDYAVDLEGRWWR